MAESSLRAGCVMDLPGTPAFHAGAGPCLSSRRCGRVLPIYLGSGSYPLPGTAGCCIRQMTRQGGICVWIGEGDITAGGGVKSSGKSVVRPWPWRIDHASGGPWHGRPRGRLQASGANCRCSPRPAGPGAGQPAAAARSWRRGGGRVLAGRLGPAGGAPAPGRRGADPPVPRHGGPGHPGGVRRDSRNRPGAAPAPAANRPARVLPGALSTTPPQNTKKATTSGLPSPTLRYE